MGFADMATTTPKVRRLDINLHVESVADGAGGDLTQYGGHYRLQLIDTTTGAEIPAAAAAGGILEHLSPQEMAGAKALLDRLFELAKSKIEPAAPPA